MKKNLTTINALRLYEQSIVNAIKNKTEVDPFDYRFDYPLVYNKRTFDEKYIAFIFRKDNFDKQVILLFIESIRLSRVYRLNKKAIKFAMSLKRSSYESENRIRLYHELKPYYKDYNTTYFVMGMLKVKDIYGDDILGEERYFKLDKILFGVNKMSKSNLKNLRYRIKHSFKLDKFTMHSVCEYNLYQIKCKVKGEIGYKVVNTIRCMFGITSFLDFNKGEYISKFNNKFFKWLDLIKDANFNIEDRFDAFTHNVNYRFLFVIFKYYAKYKKR